MFENIIVQIVIYITLIALMHYLYLFFRNNLTTPKIKDLVNKPLKNYKHIYQTLNGSKIDNTQDNSQMKDELKNFFKSLNSTKQIESSQGGASTLTSSNVSIGTYEGGDSMTYSTY